MNIGVLGGGNIGGTLGASWARAGHKVVLGVRNPDQKRSGYTALEMPQSIDFLTLGEAINASSVILFSVPSRAIPEILEKHGDQLGEKILIDATNDFRGPSLSRVSDLSACAPSARVFRAFNSLGWENFKNPRFGEVRADLFFCGPSEENARETVEELIEDIGLRPVWLGGLDMVGVVDAVAQLWMTLAVRQGRGRHLAFKVLED